MATTKIWPVRGRLKRLVDYANNPEKTEYKDLQNVIEYAGSSEKTEQFFFVSGVNCNPDKAYEEMMQVKRTFGKTGGNLAYHGYQSFSPGEVTPEQCHMIGIKLAEKLWGSRYQVIVATHLDREHLHNHFLLNSVSFIDGKKFNDNKHAYYAMRKVSDEICVEQGLYVIENPKEKTPRSIYFAEKSGEPTKFNLMREAIDIALEHAEMPQQFIKVLKSLGYEFNADPRRKYATIKAIGSKKAVRLYRLGEEYDIPAIEKKLEENRRRWNGSPYVEYKRKVYEKYRHGQIVRVKGKLRPKQKIGGLKGLYYKYCYLLGYLPKGNNRKPLSPEMKEAWRRIDKISSQVRLISKRELNSISDVEQFITKAEEQINRLTLERQKIYNRLRRCTDTETISKLKTERNSYTEKLTDLRKELKTAKQILEDHPKIKDGINREMQVKELQQEVIIKDNRNRGYER